ncbi:MAG: DUF1697 domain-containing protein [Bdellovibrionota bacterium]
MSVQIAMLRGINVSGQKLIKMEELREALGTLGFRNLRTYVQSGNVVFEGKGTPAQLSEKIRKKILAHFGHEVPVIVRSSEEIGKILAKNPFLKERDIDPTRLHVVFLSEAPAKNLISKLGAIAAGADRFHAVKTEIYLHCPKGYGNTKFSPATLERTLGVTTTTRNWNTVNQLFEMASTES